MSGSPFDHERDLPLGNVLREALTADDDEAFAERVVARLSEIEGLRRGPADWWDALYAWARPGVAAAVLGLAAGLSVWLGGGRVNGQTDVVLDNPLQPASEAFVTSALLTTTQPPSVDVVLGMALDDVPER